MTTYSEIIDAEVEFKKAASFTTARKFRDNVLAIAEGDATVPNDKRVYPPGFRRPTAASQAAVLGRQIFNYTLTSSNPFWFRGIVVTPGVYTLAGTLSTTSNTQCQIFVNSVLSFTAVTASFSHEMNLSAGDDVLMIINRTSTGSTTITDCRFLSEYHTPMCQCQFNG